MTKKRHKIRIRLKGYDQRQLDRSTQGHCRNS